MFFAATTEIECITSAQSQNTIDLARSPAELPTSLSTLVQLTELSFDIYAILPGAIETPWVYQLTNLVSLHLHFAYGFSQYSLENGLLLLSKLEHLSIDVSPQASVLFLNVGWFRMRSLVTVKFGGNSLRYRESILGITKLPSLQRLQFNRCQPADDLTAFYFGALLCNMAVQCPHVVCWLGIQSPAEIMTKYEKKQHEQLH